MTLAKKALLGTTLAAGVLAISATGADAFGGGKHGGKLGGDSEIRQSIEENLSQMNVDERKNFFESRYQDRVSNKAERESFFEMTREEMKEAKENGQSIGEILESQGKTADEVESFIVGQGTDKVDTLSEYNLITDDQASTMISSLTEKVQNMINRWFGN